MDPVYSLGLSLSMNSIISSIIQFTMYDYINKADNNIYQETIIVHL